jgi:hypothetical protein
MVGLSALAGVPSGAGSIALTLGACADPGSALLNSAGPAARIGSPFLVSPTSSVIVEFVMAVEPNVRDASRALTSLGGAATMACVRRVLTEEWNRWPSGFPAGNPSAQPQSVSLTPLDVGNAGDQTSALRVVLSDADSGKDVSNEDVVIIRDGREDALTTFGSPGAPVALAFEEEIDAEMSAHLRSVKVAP